MNELNLLIVEDEKGDIEAWQDNIEQFNQEIKDKELKIVHKICRTFKESIDIYSNDFDAAVIDLRLKDDDKIKDETGGERLINEKLEKLRLPTFVYTATPNLINVIRIEETVFFKKYVKTNKTMHEILQEIKGIYDTGITRILGGRGEIEKMLAKIFWRHLSDSFSYWLSAPENIDVERVLLRYIAAHLSEYLAVDQAGDFEKYLPPETFIMPPIGENMCTGDILKNHADNRYYIILTPSCDLVLRTNNEESPYRNAGKIVLASLIKWNNLEALSGITKDSNKSSQDKLKNYVKNKKNRYHYLPLYGDIGGMFIDFESIETHQADVLTGSFERIATISPAFRTNIVARFTQYYSRQGQPDFDVDDQVYELLSIQK